ncbi:MAG: gfo/Idh/MocA family oxidoreductase, partial [Clostridia bacterium]|nr:gfo/Idh/MocA family oxidoreductase [Clostridia bacterium]
HPLVEVQVSSFQAYPQGEMYNIQAEFGGMTGGPNGLKWKYFDPKEAPEQHLIRTPLTDKNGNPAYCGEKLPWVEESWVAGEGESAFVSAVHDFYTTVQEHLLLGKPLYIHAEEVRRQIAVIRKCHEQNPLDKFC